MKKRLKQTLAIFGVIALFTGLLLDFNDIKEIFKSHPYISGEWHFKFQVKASTYNPYIDAVTEYKVHVIQEKEKIMGNGEKWKYKGELLPYANHDPIEITGTVIDDTLYCKYNLKGISRETSGSFKGYYKDGTLVGVFSGTAADVSGVFTAEKIRHYPAKCVS